MSFPSTSPDNRSKSQAVFSSVVQKSWRWVLAALGIFLAWYALRDSPWGEVLNLLAGIGTLAIVSILLVNLFMLPLMSARWWLLLKTLGTPISLLRASLYRNAANAISYITPGPHFGGEPFLVYILRKRHGIPVSSAATSVIIDRLLELLASILILTICLLYLLGAELGPFTDSRELIIIILVLTGFISILSALFRGKRPLSRLLVFLNRLKVCSFSKQPHTPDSLLEIILKGETIAEQLFREHRLQFISANLLSIVHWLGIFAEFWLMAFFLGFPLSFLQLITVVAAARLAFFTPLPAGIGVLESALPYVTATLGLGSSLGIGLCLIIRFRDILFSLTGVVQSMKYLTCMKKTSIINDKSLK